MSAFGSLEKTLDELFVKKAPALPANWKKALVHWLPWVSLVVGVIALLNTLVLWSWAHAANTVINQVNTINSIYGGPTVSVHRLTAMIWVGLLLLLIEGLLYLGAFFGTRDRKKSGWDLWFYALLLNVVYGIVMLFTSYNSIGSFLFSLIWFAIGAYFLFQIRASYSDQPAAKAGPVKQD